MAEVFFRRSEIKCSISVADKHWLAMLNVFRSYNFLISLSSKMLINPFMGMHYTLPWTNNATVVERGN